MYFDTGSNVKSKSFLVFILTIIAFSCNSVDVENDVLEKDKPEIIEEEEVKLEIEWPLPTPPLRVVGRQLEDPCGNEVLLHGVALTQVLGSMVTCG